MPAKKPVKKAPVVVKKPAPKKIEPVKPRLPVEYGNPFEEPALVKPKPSAKPVRLWSATRDDKFK